MRLVIVGLVLAWIVLTVLSFALPAQIDGPRNLDTGFERLDIFARWQIFALAAAASAAILAWLVRDLSRGMRWLGFMPLIVVALVVVLGIVGAMLMDMTAKREAPPRPTVPTAPAASG